MAKNQNEQIQDQAVNANENLPTVSNPDGDFVPSVVTDAFTGRNVQIYSSIVDDGTREAKIKLYNAANETTGKLADQINRELEVTDLVAYPVQILTEDGELVNAMRMIFVTTNGETYASVATGVFQSLQKIIGIVGPAPWNPPLTITPINQPTRRGFKTLTLRLMK